MTHFMNIIKEAGKKRQEKEVHYKTVRDIRIKELKALAEESDLMLDGRRKKKKITAPA